jgi:hypothetical protein
VLPVGAAERAAARLRELEPEATAILLTGSYAKGTAGVGSDFDLTAVTPAPRAGYRTWFDAGLDPPLHVSAGALSAEAWRADGDEPAPWGLGFPAAVAALYLWEDGAPLGPDPSLLHPARTPSLEDFLEFVVKAIKRGATGDEAGLRWFAHAAGREAPALLAPLNPRRVVTDRRDALDAALSLAHAPESYAADAAVCLGVRAADSATIAAVISRLGGSVLAFLRQHAPSVDPQPDLALSLADGTLERHLERVRRAYARR